MNTPSPLIPQGTFLDKPGRAHIRIAVFTILAIHVVLLGALLLQGCKRTTDPTNAKAGGTNTYSSWQGQDTPPPSMNLLSNTTVGLTPPPPPSTVPGIDPSATKLPGTEDPGLTPPPLARSTEVIPPPPPPPARDEIPSPPPTSTGSEYVILKGDTFSLVAKRFGVKAQDIANANPTVDPRRLQIGQKIFIPAPSPTTASLNGTTSNGAGSGKEYVVKSGDTLSSIATKYKTTVSKIRSANGLRTDRIVVGQKLKIPE